MQTEHIDNLGPAPPKAENGVDRRHFLKISGAGIFGSLFISSLGYPGGALAQTRNGPDKSLMQEFREAAKEYGVPAQLLSAMGYVNTRWEMPPPDESEYEEGELGRLGMFGIMALTQNPSSDTLGDASGLTGIPEDELKRDRASNIRGGAALLAESQGQDKPQEIGKWFQALKGQGRPSRGAEDIDATGGVGGGELYAEQVFETVRSGARKRTQSGEKMSLQAQQVSNGGGES